MAIIKQLPHKISKPFRGHSAKESSPGSTTVYHAPRREPAPCFVVNNEMDVLGASWKGHRRNWNMCGGTACLKRCSYLLWFLHPWRNRTLNFIERWNGFQGSIAKKNQCQQLSYVSLAAKKETNKNGAHDRSSLSFCGHGRELTPQLALLSSPRWEAERYKRFLTLEWDRAIPPGCGFP